VEKYDTVYIFHDNCKNLCKHCFCKPTPACSLEETEKLIESLEQQGNNVKVMFADQSNPKILKTVKHLGYDIVELKDKVDPDYIMKLEKSNTTFGISLHGHRADIHELLCQKGNFEKTINALKQTMELKLRNVRIYCVLHKKNYLHIEELCRLAVNYGASRIIFLRLMYGGMAKKLPKNMFFDKESYIQCFHVFERTKNKFKGKIELDLLVHHWYPKFSKLAVSMIKLIKIFNRKQRFFCLGGRKKIAIQSKTKEIFPCVYTVTDSRWRIGHYDERKGIVIENSLWLKDLIEKIGEPCKSCEMLGWCGGHCRGVAINDQLLMTGEFDIYAGQTFCPVNMGLTKTIDSDEIKRYLLKMKRMLRCFLSKSRPVANS